MEMVRVVGMAVVVCGALAMFGCAEAPPPAPETAGLVLPDWTEPPQRPARSADVTHIEQRAGVLYGDPKESDRLARPKKKPPPRTGNFRRESNSRFYGGCGALNGAECP